MSMLIYHRQMEIVNKLAVVASALPAKVNLTIDKLIRRQKRFDARVRPSLLLQLVGNIVLDRFLIAGAEALDRIITTKRPGEIWCELGTVGVP